MILKCNKLLVIGRIPPPIGGVSIHVQRLISRLKGDNYPFDFIVLAPDKVFRILTLIPKYSVVHLHISNPIYRFFVITYIRLMRVHVIVTFHGDLGRFSWIKNLLDYLSVRISSTPILINQCSYDKAIIMNPKSQFVTAFIKPINPDRLPDAIVNQIKELRSFYGKVYCTNGSHLAYDKNKKEIYGILELVNLFKGINSLLVVSDPSGEYIKHYEYVKIRLPKNIIFIPYPHSFWNVIAQSDVVIRSTTTDGDSLTIHEGLVQNKIVLCSDCVSRPDGVQLFKTGEMEKLNEMISEINMGVFKTTLVQEKDGYKHLLFLYNKLIKKSL